jgi:DNA-binding NarL/FixJ family response regulator
MTNQPKTLLAVIEFISHGRLPELYQQLGFEVTTEWRVRKAVSLVRKLKPDVIVADFYFQSDFRDRLSNLESLLAAAQPLKETRILVFYEPQDEPALIRVRERMRIDAVLPTPASEEAIEAVLSEWR